MDTSANDLHQIRSELQMLVTLHQRTRAWFLRTGSAALAGAALWILIYILGAEGAGVVESLGIILGAILMWSLFLWAFYLVRKLNRVSAQVKQLEHKLLNLGQPVSQQPSQSVDPPPV